MNFTRCTLSGVGSNVNLSLLSKLSLIYPFAEWGVAYRPDMAGNARYVSYEWAQQFGLRCKLKGVRSMLKLSGDAVNQFLKSDPFVVELARNFDRVQLHDIWSRTTPAAYALDRAIAHYGRPVVTPAKTGSESFSLAVKSNLHEVLFGSVNTARGKRWPAPLAGKLSCGYGGNLGPENIISEMERIDKMCGDAAVWIVAESKLLDESGLFDLSKAEALLAAVQSYLFRNRAAAPLTIAEARKAANG